MFTNVEVLPGTGVTGGVVGTATSASVVDGVVVVTGVTATGVGSTTIECGAVGEPPPHWVTARALHNRSAVANTGRGRRGIL